MSVNGCTAQQWMCVCRYAFQQNYRSRKKLLCKFNGMDSIRESFFAKVKKHHHFIKFVQKKVILLCYMVVYAAYGDRLYSINHFRRDALLNN